MEFSINRSPDQHTSNNDVSNDRLRKAIERNRAKQAKRSTGSTRVSSPGSRFGGNSAVQGSVPNDWQSPGISSPGLSSQGRSSVRSGFGSANRPSARMNSASSNFDNAQSRFESLNQQAQATQTRSGITTTRSGVSTASSTPSHVRNRSGITTGAAPSASTTRRSVVGMNQEQDIIEPISRNTNKTASNVKYSTAKKTTRKRKAKAPSANIQKLVKGAWILCLVLFVRLIFTDGGIIDYYSTKNLLNLKKTELSEIQTENNNLSNEIDRIRADKSYQKKLVRDNLGFIAKNEYLILFPKER